MFEKGRVARRIKTGGDQRALSSSGVVGQTDSCAISLMASLRINYDELFLAPNSVATITFVVCPASLPSRRSR